MLEYALHAPEAAAGDDHGLDAIGRRDVLGGSRNNHGIFRGARGHDDEGGDRQRADGGSAKLKAAEWNAGHLVSSGSSAD
jgi:hypothetical protein